MQRARALLADRSGQKIDLIMLPEMALVGYRFCSAEDVMPFCEPVPQKIEDLDLTSMTTTAFCL